MKKVLFVAALCALPSFAHAGPAVSYSWGGGFSMMVGSILTVPANGTVATYTETWRQGQASGLAQLKVTYKLSPADARKLAADLAATGIGKVRPGTYGRMVPDAGMLNITYGTKRIGFFAPLMGQNIPKAVLDAQKDHRLDLGRGVPS